MATEPRYMQLMRELGWHFKQNDVGQWMWMKFKNGKLIASQGGKVWEKDCSSCHWGVGL